MNYLLPFVVLFATVSCQGVQTRRLDELNQRLDDLREQKIEAVKENDSLGEDVIDEQIKIAEKEREKAEKGAKEEQRASREWSAAVIGLIAFGGHVLANLAKKGVAT